MRTDRAATRKDRPYSSGEADVITINLTDKVSLAVTSSVESLGLAAKVFDNRERGLEYLQNISGTPKLIVLDAERTGSEALSLVKEIRTLLPHVRIMVATVEQKRWNLLTRTMSAIDVLEKPISNWSLGAALRRALFGGVSELSERVVVESSPEINNGSKPKTSAVTGRKNERPEEAN